jgi:predicted dinucleotide-binding enzyme
MRKIAIMGAGQTGLHLGLRLLQAGYEVSILSEKTLKNRGPNISASRKLG